MRRSATLLSLLLPLTTAAATDYLIDSVHSQAAFGVRLFWFDHVSGQFTQIAGSLHPGLQLGTYVVDARIAANSVVMISHHMRDWVLAPAFFDAQHYPTIHFVSDPLPQNELAQGGMLSGSLTLRGITAPMRFTLHPTNCTPGAMASCQINLDGNLQRSVFGMTADRATLSDRVDLRLTITLQPEMR